MRVGRIVMTLALTGVLAAMHPEPVAAAPSGQTTFAASQPLRSNVKLRNVRAHQAALQAIADAHGGNRAAQTAGYDASVAYVADQLRDAGYFVEIRDFQYPDAANATITLQRLSPTPKTYNPGPDFLAMQGGNDGTAQGTLQPVDLVLPPTPAPSSTSGCDASDFVGFSAGSIALIQRGTCTFNQKALNAMAAGAAGVIIFNEGQPGRTDTGIFALGSGVTIPVLFASFAVGNELAQLAIAGPVTVRLSQQTPIATEQNVIAESTWGDPNSVIVVGAHLDSRLEGPGINDNGSGTAVILETAIQMAKLGHTYRNRVRFAFWGAEEIGLIGSTQYVAQLVASGEIANVAANLNFDMLGSPNFVRFVYDGDGSTFGLVGPTKGDISSAEIERVFVDFLAHKGLQTEPTAFDGRSDYGPFIAVGIPAGGLFSGAEVPKTPAQVAIYGGTAGIPYDPCYHLACDTFDNNSDEVLGQFTQATAHAVAYFAERAHGPRTPRTPRGAVNLNALPFRGPIPQR